MRCTVSGVVLEKVIVDDVKDGVKVGAKYILRLFQRGRRENIDAKVPEDIFLAAKENEEVTLTGRVTVWNFAGKFGLTFIADGVA